jgi:hypothetical protein
LEKDSAKAKKEALKKQQERRKREIMKQQTQIKFFNKQPNYKAKKGKENVKVTSSQSYGNQMWGTHHDNKSSHNQVPGSIKNSMQVMQSYLSNIAGKEGCGGSSVAGETNKHQRISSTVMQA